MNANFPAVLIGGPPHSGKSVLVYSLTRALRDARVAHYVLRACPDGEGDWANEADQVLVQTIRHKGPFSAAFTRQIEAYLQRRHLPLLVDVGGQPTAAQEAVFSECTHAILLVARPEDDPAAFDRDLETWRSMMRRQGVAVVAEITSRLHGENSLAATDPIVTGTLAGLERGKMATGPALATLVQRLQGLFSFSEAELTRLHLAQAPVELTLDLPALARTLGSEDGYWKPEQLPHLAAYLPAGKPLAPYGRAPNWVYAMLGLVAQPAPVWLFDARLGWVQPPVLPAQAAAPQAGWQVLLHHSPDYTLVDMRTQSQFLDIRQPQRLPLPPVPAGKGMVLSGKVPHWLMMAAARRFAPQTAWTAVYQPPIGAAVVIDSKDGNRQIGEQIPLTLS